MTFLSFEAPGFNLKAVNPNSEFVLGEMSPEQMLDKIEAKGCEIAETPAALRAKR